MSSIAYKVSGCSASDVAIEWELTDHCVPPVSSSPHFSQFLAPETLLNLQFAFEHVSWLTSSIGEA